MSLINKMLQDLDARGGNGAQTGASSAVRPVSYGARSISSQVVIGAAIAGAVVIVGGAFAAWKYMHPAAPAAAGAPSSVAARAQSVVPAVPEVAPAIPVPTLAATGQPEASAKDDVPAAATRQPVRMERATTLPSPATEGEKPVSARMSEKQSPGMAAARAREVTTAAQAATPVAEQGDAGLSSQQKAENEYRRALAKLQDARVSEALAGLEQAVYLYPRHEAARQTLVSLLIEGGRPAEAIRHLTFATNLDPRQANMAMLLARLQLENGGDALATLRRSLPYAESNPDYQALIAGALQRANRHAEAAEHYQAAVRLQPSNGIWWMGLGISLQAEKRNADARAAFQRARDSGRLSPELQTFVERRLQQLN